MKLKIKTLFAATFMSASLGFATQVFAQSPQAHAHPGLGTSKITQTGAALRDLWTSHAFWVRAVVAETLSGNSAAAAAAENAAVDNAKQLAASMEPFYGKPASAEVFSLLAGHYTAVKQYLLATRARSTAEQEAARQAMVKNAEQIAVFLSGANPHLPIDALRGMLLAHGGHHVLQIRQMADKQYAQEAQTWEAMKNHMYGVADALTVAIAKQFPAKFE